MENSVRVATGLDAKERELVEKLESLEGRSGNVSLREALSWADDIYWSTRDRLVDRGVLQLGRGRGGSVRLVEGFQGGVEPPARTPQTRSPERNLYQPVATVLNEDWARDMRFLHSRVDITAEQGRRNTGGTWTRPDIVIAGLRVFPHIPGKYFDLITFEVKPADAIDVTGVFEALAHRRAATQAYLWLHMPEDSANEGRNPSELQDRILEEARRHGVGLIVASSPGNYNDWDIRLRARRVEPDPEALNEFIAQQLSAAARDELAQWFR